jgi:hypothetical protein
MFCGGFVVWLGRPMLIFWGGFCPPVRPPKPFYISKASQSRQNDKLFLQSSELGLPQFLIRRRVCPSPRFWGEGHTRLRERGGGRVPIPTRGHTLWYSLNITVRTLCKACSRIPKCIGVWILKKYLVPRYIILFYNVYRQLMFLYFIILFFREL